jgi:spermidine/putrescine transport system substrate-binding protein
MRRLCALLLLLVLPAAAGCGHGTRPDTGADHAARELVLYNWADYMPQQVLDAFQAEYGVRVTQVTFESMEEATESIQRGRVRYDLAVIEHDELPALIAGGYLATIDHSHVPNLRNISPNFLDLAVDPGNKHSVPYSWGSTGLLVRSDLVGAAITRWADLWDPRWAGRVGSRAQPTELLSIALKASGLPLNAEEPEQLETALQRLDALRPSLVFLEYEDQKAVAKLLSGEIVVMAGWNGDALLAKRSNPAVEYVLPAEGPMLWGDGLVISSASPNRRTAELFLDFVLRPEVSAQIVEAYGYPTANEAARAYVDSALHDDPLVFPARDQMGSGEWYLPLSPAVQKLYDEAWQRFVAAGGPQEKP